MGFFSSKSKSSSSSSSTGAQTQTGDPLAINVSTGKKGRSTVNVIETTTDHGAIGGALDFASDALEVGAELGNSALAANSLLSNEVLRRDSILTAQVVDLLGAQYESTEAITDNNRASFQTVSQALNDGTKQTQRLLGGLVDQQNSSLIWIGAGALVLVMLMRRG